MRGIHATVAAASFLLLAASAGAAPAIDQLTVGRDGDDLVLTWTATAPADGYRVYRYDELTCSSGELVYDGPDRALRLPGALVDFSPALFRVAAVTAGVEGPLSGPIYRYAVDVPPPMAAGDLLSALAAPPYVPSCPDALTLCGDVNGGVGRDEPITAIGRALPASGTFETHFCSDPTSLFPIAGQTGYHLAQPNGATTPAAVLMWGHGHGEWRIDLPEAARLGPNDEELNRYRVSLPFDHDYPDLKAVADDIPEALEVWAWRDCAAFGLSRASTAEPWTGDNLTLGDHRGHGLIIAVDRPAVWVPRRLCLGEGLTTPSRVTSLKAVRRGDDVELSWRADPRATAGYDVFRLSAPDEPLDPTVATPHLAVPQAAESLTATDAGAAAAPDVHYYQVVAESSTGELGPI